MGVVQGCEIVVVDGDDMSVVLNVIILPFCKACTKESSKRTADLIKEFMALVGKDMTRRFALVI